MVCSSFPLKNRYFDMEHVQLLILSRKQQLRLQPGSSDNKGEVKKETETAVITSGAHSREAFSASY